MAKQNITINLLPKEFLTEQQVEQKFKSIQRISLGSLSLLILLTIGVGMLRIFESRDLTSLNSQLNQGEAMVTASKNKEVDLTLLKNRVMLISNILRSSTSFTSSYDQVDTLVPTTIVITSLAFDKSGGITMSVVAPDSGSISQLVDNLTRTDSASKIKNVVIDNFSRGSDGSYRASFKMTVSES